MKWFRLYSELVDDPKVHQMNPKTFKIFIFLLCFASEFGKNGIINLPHKEIIWRLRCSRKKYFDAVAQLEELHILSSHSNGLKFLNWDKRQYQGDNSSKRVEKYRNKREELGLSRGSHYPREEVFTRDNFECVYCGNKENLCVDHAFPIQKGGDDNIDNLVTACKACNAGKSGRTPEEAEFTWKNSKAKERYIGYLKQLQSKNDTVTVTPPEQNRNRTDTEKDPQEPSARSLKKLLVTPDHEKVVALASKDFPGVFKFMQRAINNETSWDDLIGTIENFVEYKDDIEEPWAYCEALLKAKTQKHKTIVREEEWNKRKIQEKKGVQDWLKSFGKGE